MASITLNNSNGDWWNQVQSELKSHLPGLFFENFIEPLTCETIQDHSRVLLRAADDKSAQHIEHRYGDLMRSVIQPFLPVGFSLEFGSGVAGNSSLKPSDHAHEHVIEEGPAFICDAAMRPVIESLRSCTWKGIQFIHGPSGSGKTMLGRKCVQQQGGRYYSLEEFMVSFAASSRDGSLLDWKKQLHGTNLVVLDDLQFLRQKAVRTSEQLRSLMDSALQNRLQLILMADVPAAQLDCGADIRSRLLEARPIQLNYLNAPARKEMLRELCSHWNLTIAEDSLHYIAENVSGDHRKLQNALHRLAIQADRPTDLEWLTSELSDLVKSPVSVEPSRVLSVVCRFYGVHPDLLSTDARDRKTVRARHLSAYFLYRHCGQTLSEIAAILGRKDHSAVLYGIKKTEELFKQDLFLARQASELEREICR
ncbi:MAG: hypothetical protein KDK37_10185 [Leptospiraceae bacterium]|nr:hypothetical protein [Leptospiraceae bacterium]